MPGVAWSVYRENVTWPAVTLRSGMLRALTAAVDGGSGCERSDCGA